MDIYKGNLLDTGICYIFAIVAESIMHVSSSFWLATFLFFFHKEHECRSRKPDDKSSPKSPEMAQTKPSHVILQRQVYYSVHPVVMWHIAIENCIFIVVLPNFKMVMIHFATLNHQRIYEGVLS